ncbi:hypothetical protein TREMEDRAFT_61376 [Tremella mesenterica DSM 1558]|uniref:uncharacterized protein n=1 Tax=Tremella mesenterica (strain ATCC 24925 / CBS 8224 / DSM 1558 / NBRC 9311 / NRRL Y-6157 / RJB 2259-6 / UBC 559-6) TaxID=578456 RepID=UPI0003F496E8|nr:uncharacterized protein TREMEDRAFT_61376 [Tremella mesenterica DSM 1558]EIW70864.1 hypothetical protein TREMEDRAFT_61376 [Tremella mesenterica DSM 1558]
MRIASGGDLNNYVKFALSFLKETPQRPLTLHTRPLPITDASKPKQTKTTMTLQTCTTSIPKLISVVERVKREYIVWARETSRKGLWQYTITGSENQQATVDLNRVLEGKTKPKMSHHPWLEITLSTSPLGLEKEYGVTCQYVLTGRKRSKKGRKNMDTPHAPTATAGPTVIDTSTETEEKVVETPSSGQNLINDGKKKRKSEGSQTPKDVKRKKTS